MPPVTTNRLVTGLVGSCTALVLTACGGAPARPVARPSGAPSASAAAPTRFPAPLPATWPLTGLPAGASAQVGAPALSVKVDNAPAARPQSGLNEADLVFDCLVEGGLSRFLAVYQSQSADLIGLIRSARPVDGALLRALKGGIFAYSGAARGEIAPAQAYSTAFLLSNDNDPRPYFRLASRRAPQNVYASTTALRAEAARRQASCPHRRSCSRTGRCCPDRLPPAGCRSASAPSPAPAGAGTGRPTVAPRAGRRTCSPVASR